MRDSKQIPVQKWQEKFSLAQLKYTFKPNLFILLTLSIFWVRVSNAQADRYAIYFKNKAGTPFTVSQPEKFISAKAVERRLKRKVTISENDLPVNPAHLQQIKETSVKILFSSRWFNCVIVEASASAMALISQLPIVLKTEYVGKGSVPSISSQLINYRSTSSNEFASRIQNITAQLEMIGIDQMHADGLQGEGITVAVTDSGFPGINSADAFNVLKNQIKDSYNFVFNQANVFGFDNHGTDVLTVIGGISNVFRGSAPKADFLLYVTEHVPTEFRIEEYNWLLAAERADSAGADLINISLGYTLFDDPSMNYTYSDMNGKTTIISRAAKLAASKGILVVASAGNEGSGSWQYVSAPADAAEVIAAGAVDAVGVRAAFSSKGPTADSRVKPDLMALGVEAGFLNQLGNPGSGSGTSFSAPIITGLAAGIMQAFPDATIEEILFKLRSSGTTYSQPNNLMGYGIPDYNKIKSGVITRIHQDTGYDVYPNPVTGGFLYVRSEGGTVPQLFNHQGKRIDITFINNENEFRYSADVSGLTSGLYFLKIGIKATKVIIK